MSSLELKNVTKKYGKKIALDGFSFSFEDQIYAILGANGSGKTTLLNLITDNLKPTSGSIMYDGTDIHDLKAAFRGLIGFVPQQQKIYEGLSLERFMYYMASLKGLKKKEADSQVEMLLSRVHLLDVRDKMLGGFSGGMKQRALLAQALLGDPKILVLDEPTAGVDPAERIAIRNLISEVSDKKTIIIATHIVSDIELIADKVIILKNGRIVMDGAPAALCEGMKGRVREIRIAKGRDSLSGIKGKISSITPCGNEIEVRIIDSKEGNGTEVFPTLEELFLDIFDQKM